MILPQLVWAIKKLLSEDSTILSRDPWERDIAVRIGWWRNQLIKSRLTADSMSLQDEWMQPLLMRKTTYGKIHSNMAETCHVIVGGNITKVNGLPLCKLYTANFENEISPVKPMIFGSYSTKTLEYGGYICTSRHAVDITISPSVDMVNGGVVVDDPLAFLMDTDTGTRLFNMDIDEYPVDGDIATAIVLEICKEFGIRKELGPQHVKFNPADSLQS